MLHINYQRRFKTPTGKTVPIQNLKTIPWTGDRTRQYTQTTSKKGTFSLSR